MLAALLTAAVADGAGTALDVRGARRALLSVTGTFDARVNFEGSLDGTNWFPVEGRVNNGREESMADRTCRVRFEVEDLAYIRPNVSAFVSGAVTVEGYAKLGSNYTHFDAATAGTLVKTGPGVLGKAVIGDVGTTQVVTLRDGLTVAGPVIAVLKNAGSFDFECAFDTGLFVVITAGAAGDVTVGWL